MGNVCDYYNKRESSQRRQLLQNGSQFDRKVVYFGLLKSMESIHLKMNATATRLEWTKLNDKRNKIEEIPISNIKVITAAGDNDLTLVSAGGEKLLELECPSPSIRDVWVELLEEICETVNSESEGHDEVIKEREESKKKYWQSRTAELEKREIEAAEKNKKLGLVGMKYTAQAMSRR
ncbi:hypothetical protein ABG067_003257 [Albugo candida]